ncbi:unnamed protein product [Discula destructiva]
MEDFSPFSWTVLPIFGLVIYLLYHFYIYPAFISPLSKIPNAHWSVSVSPLWILHKRFKHRENGSLTAAHKKYGPFVRIAPNEVSVDNLDAVKQVYIGGFEKPEWYSIFDNYGVPCMFSERPSKSHSLRKRMISHVYSKSYIHNSPAAAAQAAAILQDRFIPAIQDSLAGHEQGTLDVYSLYLAATMDFISAYIWGLARSTNFVQDKGYREHWLALYKARNDFAFFPQELPRLTAFCKDTLRWWLYPRWVDSANAELAALNDGLCDRTLEDLDKSGAGKTDGVDDPVVMRALLAGLDKEAARGESGSGDKSPIYSTAVLERNLTIRSELWDHVLAGQETAGLALTYLTWRLSQHPALQAQLCAELRNSSSSSGSSCGSDHKALDTLPLLHAVTLETLRLHAPIPGPQPREVPRTGAQIGPYTVPAGVRIAALAETLHRDATVFPDPERWDPMRWIREEEEPESRAAMQRQFWAFSSGGRMCIGSNFAMHEMKLLAAAVYTNYMTHIVDDTGIEQGDGYTGRPAGEQLWVRFEKVTLAGAS